MEVVQKQVTHQLKFKRTNKMPGAIKISDKIYAAGQSKDIEEEWPEGATKLVIGKWNESREETIGGKGVLNLETTDNIESNSNSNRRFSCCSFDEGASGDCGHRDQRRRFSARQGTSFNHPSPSFCQHPEVWHPHQRKHVGSAE